MANHTPTPWTVERGRDGVKYLNVDEHGGGIPLGLTDEQADYLGRVLSSHADLVAALRSIIDEFAQDKADQGMCADSHTLGRINRARAALAKAGAL